MIERRITSPFGSRAERASRGRVLSEDDAMALGHRLLALAGDRAGSVLIEHTVSSILKCRHDRILASHDGDEVRIHFDAVVGSGIHAHVGVNQLDDATLRQVVARVLVEAPPQPPVTSYPDAPARQSVMSRPHIPVHLWHEPTVAAMDDVRDTVLPRILSRMQGTSLQTVATIGLVARSVLYLYRGGLTAWGQETDSEMTMTARTTDGGASGWYGEASRDWSKIPPETIVERAIEVANRSRNSVATEPGRRTAILGPAAVAQLVAAMAYMFNAEKTDLDGGLPFSVYDEDRHRNKIGLRVIDPRLTMVSDPADPQGGYLPFFEMGEGQPGLPVQAMTWIDRGILKNMAYSADYAAQRGKPWNRLPCSVRLTSASGTPLHTIDEMIAQCANGIYVNRFSNLSVIDPATGIMTGTTRDGCFLVQNGAITKPVKNFRILESPLFAFNRLRAVGVPTRVAFGYAPPSGDGRISFGSWPPMGRDQRWPLAPVIVPPLMVDDFNFSTLSEAV